MKFNKRWLSLPLALALILVMGVFFAGGCPSDSSQAVVDEEQIQTMVDNAVKDAFEDLDLTDEVAAALKDMDPEDLNIEVSAECCVAELELISFDMDCPEPDSWFQVFGSGFPTETRITLYFLSDGDPVLKWFRVDTNESGAFTWCGPLPSFSEFNEDLFKDVEPCDNDALEDCFCDEDMWMLTIGAYEGNDLLATQPMYIYGGD